MFALVGRSIESLRQVARGLSTVLMHAAREPITKEFPDTMPKLAGHFRGRLALAVNPQSGDHLCISCLQCERVCPDKCIQITSHKSPETNKPELINFKIDHGLCMFCGLCTEVCPTSCIINTNDFEMADYTRESLVYDLRKLTLTQDESAHYFAKKELPMPKPKPKPAPKPAAAAAAKPAAEKPAADPQTKAEAKPQDKPVEAKAEPKAEAAAEAPKTEAPKTEAKPEEIDKTREMARPESKADKTVELDIVKVESKSEESKKEAEESKKETEESKKETEESKKEAEESKKEEES